MLTSNKIYQTRLNAQKAITAIRDKGGLSDFKSETGFSTSWIYKVASSERLPSYERALIVLQCKSIHEKAAA